MRRNGTCSGLSCGFVLRFMSVCLFVVCIVYTTGVAGWTERICDSEVKKSARALGLGGGKSADKLRQELSELIVDNAKF